MAETRSLSTTQRAYTLRLRGASPDDHSWRDALWATHEAVNKGAKVFGEWLLTLRGGLCHTLADAKIAQGRNKPERHPTLNERRDRRILLALSWLAVEDEHGAPKDAPLLVAEATDSTDCRSRKLCDALTSILRGRGVVDRAVVGNPNRKPEDQPGTWLGDCMPSLSAAVREDAVWVNRSEAFDAVARRCPSLDREQIWDFFEPFLGNKKAYFSLAEQGGSDEGGNKGADEGDGEDTGDGKAEDSLQRAKAKDLVKNASGWLSRRAGGGPGADFAQLSAAYDAIAQWAASAAPGASGKATMTLLAGHLVNFSPASLDADGVLSVISATGHKSATRNHLRRLGGAVKITPDDLNTLAERAGADARTNASKISAKGGRPYASTIIKEVEAACAFTYLQSHGRARHPEFSVMLDHAARRVNVAHSWIKNAEARRRQFEEDARRRDRVPRGALDWLQEYCRDRSSTSGALDEYRIRRRAVDGWDKVVERWSGAECQTADDRIAAARQLQDEVEKFGDVQLFESLAADDGLCVWKPDGNPSPQPLRDFVYASDAEFKKRRFKVPAYRHPDALRHPVFADFGNSRWGIEFSAHRAPARLAKASETLARCQDELAKAKQSFANAFNAEPTAMANTDPAVPKKKSANVDKCRDKLGQVEHEHAFLRDTHQVRLTLWDGRTVEPLALRWSCKRLVADLAIGPAKNAPRTNQIIVSRADRLGRAAVGADGRALLRIAGLFDQEHWNGRLQAPRRQLDAIARHVEKYGEGAQSRKMIGRIRWLVSFSVELAPRGPWYDYVADSSDKTPFLRTYKSGTRQGADYVGLEAWPHEKANAARQGHARLVLARLRGLRVLSVDLGHRYAAACAVWEAITRQQIDRECTSVGVTPPSAEAMYLHLKGASAQGKPTTTIYRRIGPDALPDGSPHPAPWARLDRQFLIKLQGEERAARKASPEEIGSVAEFERWSGLIRAAGAARGSPAVDALMNDAVRTARLALGRHGRRARIAHNLTAATRTLPGGRQEMLDDATRLELLTDTLADWHALAVDSRWNDDDARQLWNEHLAALPGGFAIDEPAVGSEAGELTSAERRMADKQVRRQLGPLASALAHADALRREFHDAWDARWQSNDRQWPGRLRWLSRWLMPRGRKRRDASYRHVGGLSLLRISTLTEFRRKVQVGYFNRMKPDGGRADLPPSFGQATLGIIGRLKEQRVKQLASRIVEAALGIGIERHREDGRDSCRPRERIADPRFAACHAVVIEDLSHYRPEETRTRRENRATMDWKSAEVRERLADHCQLYGLHLRDVNPGYTSRQDSRTGAPGVRCVDVRVADFLGKPWWRKQVARARTLKHDGKGTARDRYLAALDEKWSAASEEEKRTAKPLRIPLKGGELFVSADDRSPPSGGIQADLNAAANIGLRALTDPDFPGKWWYVPCDPGTRAPKADKVKGGILDGAGPLQTALSATAPDTGKRRHSNRGVGRTKEAVNLWRDPAPSRIVGAEGGETWREWNEYWNAVQERIVRLLVQQAGMRW